MDLEAPPFQLTASHCDDVISALIGNGSLATTLSPTGWHVPPDLRREEAHVTQQFTWAGRRMGPPRHAPVNMGSIWRELLVDCRASEVLDWSQTLEPHTGVVMSEWRHRGLSERTRSWIAVGQNLFCADTVLTNETDHPLEVVFTVAYRFGESSAEMVVAPRDDRFSLEVECGQHLFAVEFMSVCESGGVVGRQDGATVSRSWSGVLQPAASVLMTTALQFADRQTYHLPIQIRELDGEAENSEAGWRSTFSRAGFQFSDEMLTRTASMCLYTIASQKTEWSVPKTLSPRHLCAYTPEEYVPIMALLSLGDTATAGDALRFRAETLLRHRRRHRQRGALPHWSTEEGEECSPLGAHLAEAPSHHCLFELVWQLYRASGDPGVAAEYLPLLRALRSFEGSPRTLRLFEQLQLIAETGACCMDASDAANVPSGVLPLPAAEPQGYHTKPADFGFCDDLSPDTCAGSIAAASRLAQQRALQWEGARAWEILMHGLSSFGVGPCPVEWKDAGGEAHNPWSTVSAGHWLLALSSLFVQVGDVRSMLLPALPPQCGWAEFRGLSAGAGVRISGRVENGQVSELSAYADTTRLWHFCIPQAAVPHSRTAGEVTDLQNECLFVRMTVGPEPVSILK
jgi:hypothetical protein